ncbi:MAG TPA: hypothetical protein DCF84_09195 [Bacteroidetes bacterium]|nr:hypothetical protein [Bacteroidota bacterium]
MYRIIILLSIILSTSAYADSPLTSTDLTKGYEKDEMVQYAKASGGDLDDRLIDFLLDDNNALSRRLIVINAIGWEDGTFESRTYDLLVALSDELSMDIDMLMTNNPEDMQDIISGEIFLCLSYIAALESYSESPAFLFDLIEVAYNDVQVQKSFTAMTVIGLIRAQHFMDYDWCTVYQQTDVLRQNKSSFKMDLSKEAYNNVFEYMDLYADDCFTEAE